MIEFDVDMGYLLEEDELDCVVLNDENGEHEPMEFVPKLGSGTCRLEETESYPSERGTVHVLECSECGQECEHVNGDYEHCPHCMARNELF